MIKTLKHLSIIGLIVLVITGTYYAKQDRFDVVACVLILINAVAFFWSELPKAVHQPFPPIEGFPFIPGPRPIFDAEHLLEHFDEGYITGLKDHLEFLLEKHYTDQIGVFDHVVLTMFNNMPKVKALGRFNLIQLVDKSHRINFVKRYPDEQ